jgi:hypothetical protein
MGDSPLIGLLERIALEGSAAVTTPADPHCTSCSYSLRL